MFAYLIIMDSHTYTFVFGSFCIDFCCLCAGLLLWSIIWIQEGQHIAGSLAFAVLVNMKHLYACLAPVYLIYLLRHYCR